MAAINIKLNGEVREVPEMIDIYRLLEFFSLSNQRVAVELNGSVVRRVDWPTTRINDSDKLEVVHFVGGG